MCLGDFGLSGGIGEVYKRKESHYYIEQARTTLSVKHLSLLNSIGIADAHVSLVNLGLSGQTDSNGQITFYHTPSDSLVIITAAIGYFSDTTVVRQLSTDNTFTVRLNARPQMTLTEFNSLYGEFEGVPEGYVVSAHIRTFIEDIDGIDDIANVILINRLHSFRDTLMLVNTITGEFSSSFGIKDIDEGLLPGEFPELNFELIVKNLNGDSVVSNNLTVRRVITKTTTLLTPGEGEALQDSVVFKWEKMNFDFSFTYNLIYSNIQTFQQYRITGIPSDQTTVMVKNLIPGSYSWQVQVEDRLGNRSQSKISIFRYAQ